MVSDTAAKCDPALHDGATVLAAFTVREATALRDTVDGTSYRQVGMGRIYACCADHLNVAMAHCFIDGAEHVIVRREKEAV